MKSPGASDQVENIVQDILSIRRSIHAVQASKEGKIGEVAYQTQLRLQVTALSLATGFALIEFLGGRIITSNLLKPLPIAHANFFIALSIAAFLALCVAVNYYSVASAAKKTGDSLQNYIRRNFSYLRDLGHVSDLAVKFIVIATLLHLGHPELIAAFLMIFTADYLLQGRFFTLPPKTAQILAILTLAAAAMIFISKTPDVGWPLIWFSILTAFSIQHLKKMKRVED